jgi:hypothetical protein
VFLFLHTAVSSYSAVQNVLRLETTYLHF